MYSTEILLWFRQPKMPMFERKIIIKLTEIIVNLFRMLNQLKSKGQNLVQGTQ
jgi:hypothetical protein